MRTLIASIALIVTTSGGFAYCPTMPENAASAYVNNTVRHALCLASELSDDVAARNRLTDYSARLDSLGRQAQQQDFMATQRSFIDPLPMLPPLP